MATLASETRQTQNTEGRVEYSIALGTVRNKFLLLLGSALLMAGIWANLQVYPESLASIFGVQVPENVVALVGMALIGLISGLLVRFLFPKSHLYIQLSLGLLLVLLSWYCSEITQNFIRERVLSLPLVNDSYWRDLGALAVGAVGALLLIRFTQPKMRLELTSISQEEAVENEGDAPMSNLRQAGGNFGQWLNSSIIKLREARDKAKVKKVPSQNRIKIVVPKQKSNSNPLRWRLLPRRSNIHLGADATTVCPYCLEEVTEGQPKVVCDVCGTAHHADCWEITGKCQVPHLQR